MERFKCCATHYERGQDKGTVLLVQETTEQETGHTIWFQLCRVICVHLILGTRILFSHIEDKYIPTEQVSEKCCTLKKNQGSTTMVDATVYYAMLSDTITSSTL